MLELDRLPHALLFSGPSGIGKRIAAEVFAAQVLQTEPSLLEAHPDFFSVTCDGAQIRIAQIRELQRLAGFVPVRGKHRICLIDPADCMEPPAANSLLKILEEPPEGLIFILITAFPHALLTTLRSRAAMVRFVRPAPGVWQAEEPETAAADRKQAVDFLRNMERPDLEWLWPTLSGMEEMENSRILDIIKQWIWVLRDLGVLLTGYTETGAIDADRQEELRSMTGQWDIPRIAAAISLAEDTRRHLQRNANSRLMLESLLIRSADLYWGGNVNADYRRSPV
jgi:DNA polymerase-3 subunit delta'